MPPPPVHALIVAAGAGIRAGGDRPKQYRAIAGRSMIARAITALSDHSRVDRVTVVIGPGQQHLYEAAVPEGRPDAIEGGVTRAISVCNGLSSIDGPDDAIVLIHDAARPFLPHAVIDRLIAALDDADGAIPFLPVVDTLARGGETLGDVVPRDGLVRIQTPQAFRLGAIRRAHAAWAGDEPTDDAQVARAAGLRVVTVEGDTALEKLTLPADFERASARLAPAMRSRTGFGYDVHAVCEGDHIWLGGLQIPHSHGLAGHSDADVVLHAIVDALLGTIGAGDIGMHFPPSDPRWKGAASSRFVDHACALIEAEGGAIGHVDVTVICEAPKVGPHREAIRANVAALLDLDPRDVSIKATTTERLGFTGRGEGIAAQAVATVRVPEDR